MSDLELLKHLPLHDAGVKFICFEISSKSIEICFEIYNDDSDNYVDHDFKFTGVEDVICDGSLILFVQEIYKVDILSIEGSKIQINIDFLLGIAMPSTHLSFTCINVVKFK